jgi:hypothetical protein
VLGVLAAVDLLLAALAPEQRKHTVSLPYGHHEARISIVFDVFEMDVSMKGPL